MESHGLSRKLRHLRLLLSGAETGSLTHSASILNVSQPAVTQAIGKLERETGGRLFDRTRQGIFPPPRCEVLARRLRRAFDRLDPALTDVAPRLMLTATWAQLQSLVAVHEAENFTLAARRLGLAQPTVHRAISQLEQEAGQSLFERTAFGLLPTRQTRALVQAVMLAFAELDQADSDLSELDGGETGQIVVGSLPLSRSVLLPRALARFREQRPRYPVMVIDGRYDELLGNLRRGEVDLIIGALRQPAPIDDITQVKLFDDHLSVLARRDHPLAVKTGLTAKDLQECKWVVPRRGTPSREHFDALFAPIGLPESIIEAGSILLMRELLAESDHLGCISSVQAQAELSHQLLSELDVTADWPARPIGLTYRENWVPTKAQALLIDINESEAKTLSI